MTSLVPGDFAVFHRAVHGFDPFTWQRRLVEQVVRDRAWPEVLDLPTGSGKTTCIDVALFVLALDAQAKPAERWAPRRIVMVVDRRVVVDQAAVRGRKLLATLLAADPDSLTGEVARRLRSLSSEAEEPIGVYTLRGGIPKDDSWARTPDQALVIASTVDQLGSRLLVQGYGVSSSMRPVHAGLLGNDTLLLLDEVHLSQPFKETLDGLTGLRSRFASAGLAPRFQRAYLSATPGESAGRPFGLSEAEKGPGSALARRLAAPKRARLVSVADRNELEQRCTQEAIDLAREHRTIGVVVNRVGSALTVASALREVLSKETDPEVALLTGRMRPLDRDDAMTILGPRITTGRTRSAGARRLIVVGTQCIEAGADFDFDALVTESASLDALRQRFGRVDRLGEYQKAEGVIVHDKAQKDEDPVYGAALPATVKWLSAHLDKKKRVDFGVLALPVPHGDELATVLAPRQHAPTLLPAYLDLWTQTSPEPAVAPDVSLFLHGPQAGPADVQIVWRADLDLTRANDEEGASIVGAVRPTSMEAVSVPFALARRWLAGTAITSMAGADVEGVADDSRDTGDGNPRRALAWRGDDSTVIDATDLRPGQTIVVPTSYGGIASGTFDPSAKAPVTDLAERAAFMARGRPVLRLHPDVLAGLGVSVPVDDDADARGALAREATTATGWMRLWLERLSKSRRQAVVSSWRVLEGARVGLAELRAALASTQAEAEVEAGTDLTSDDEDSPHIGRAVLLAVHSRDVESFARRYCERLALPDDVASDIALAGWLHDIGKADRRFQVLLRGGSEVAYYRENEALLAKSAMLPSARSAHAIARAKSGYPRGGRHEVQSLAMIEAQREVLAQAHDADLVLHLVASHHGYCRPFAPVVIDAQPVQVGLAEHTSDYFGTVTFDRVSSAHGLHQLDSPLGTRFWSLVERYGWLELCWLEAILRLADHRASEMEETHGA